jgi:hypothetical protein
MNGGVVYLGYKRVKEVSSLNHIRVCIRKKWTAKKGNLYG